MCVCGPNPDIGIILTTFLCPLSKALFLYAVEFSGKALLFISATSSGEWLVAARLVICCSGTENSRARGQRVIDRASSSFNPFNCHRIEKERPPLDKFLFGSTVHAYVFIQTCFLCVSGDWKALRSQPQRIKQIVLLQEKVVSHFHQYH